MGRKDPDKKGMKPDEELEAARKRINELEWAVRSLRELEEKGLGTEALYRSVVESTDDSIYLLDAETNYIFMNRRHIERLGIKETEYLGKSYNEFHNPSESEEFLKELREFFRTGNSVQFQHRSQRNGQYFLRTLSPIKAEDGSVSAVAVLSKDINRLKRAEFERDKIIFELQDAMQQIRTLKGLIPICAWCKKIRNDEGLWQKIESYIMEHSEADFTHGICEECAKKVEEEGED